MMKAKGGAILNITSVSGLVGMAGQVNYSASKAGLVGLTKARAWPRRSRTRRDPSQRTWRWAIHRDRHDRGRFLEANRKQALELVPLGRFGRVDEIAPIAAFLLSDARRSYITGAVINVVTAASQCSSRAGVPCPPFGAWAASHSRTSAPEELRAGTPALLTSAARKEGKKP